MQAFADDDVKMEAAITTALDTLKVARTNLAVCNKEATGVSGALQDGGEISDEEIVPDPGPAMTEDIKMVLASLGQLKQKADATFESEASAKKLCVRPEPALEVKQEHGARSAPSLQPFAVPGQ